MNLGDLQMKLRLYLMIAKPTICGFVASRAYTEWQLFLKTIETNARAHKYTHSV